MAGSSSTSSSKGLLRLLLKCTLLLLLVVGMDQACGRALAGLYRQTREGDFGGRINLALEQQSDLVVFGSSRALHHYIPSVLESKTGLSSFNAGMDAQTLLYHYSLQQMLFERYRPKFILLDLNTEDLRSDPNRRAYDKLAKLRPFAHHPVVHSLLTRHHPYEAIKLHSQIYRYNSMLLSILRYWLKPHSEGSAAKAGYVPLRGSLHGTLASHQTEELDPSLDAEYVSILRQFVSSARQQGTEVILCQSPLWEMVNDDYRQAHPELLRQYLDLARELDLPVVSITQKEHESFRDTELFRDPLHLNHRGAELFSTLLANELVEKKLVIR